MPQKYLSAQKMLTHHFVRLQSRGLNSLQTFFYLIYKGARIFE